MRNFWAGSLLALSVLCGGLWALGDRAKNQADVPLKLVTVLVPTENSEVRGVVVFERHPKGVFVKATAENLSKGPHGFHIHVWGDLRDPNAKQVGPHFGVDHHAEGSEGSEGSGDWERADGRPIGDLEMLVAGADGHASMEMVIPDLSLSDILGRSVMIHEHEDRFVDGKWDSGRKVAMGVVGRASP